MRHNVKAIMFPAENGRYAVLAMNKSQSISAQKRDINAHLALVGYKPLGWYRDEHNNPVCYAEPVARVAA